MARVLVIYTGGTIGMVPRDSADPTSPLRPAPKEELARFVPNPLGRVAWDLSGLADEEGRPIGPLDSASIGPRHWGLIAAQVGRAYDAYDGFVVLHGTDTMAYTASALSFLFDNLGKPVVLTGAQLPIFAARTDAIANFTHALTVAGTLAVPEVAVCFGGSLLRGNRSTKVSSYRFQGFASPNHPPLARLADRIELDPAAVRPAPTGHFAAATALEPEVTVLTLHPGMPAEVADALLALERGRGVVLRSYGAGNAPGDPHLLRSLSRATRAGKVVVNTSQCLEGRVEMGRYEASEGLAAAGVVSGHDLTVEAAVTKLMRLLALHPAAEAARLMQVDLRGEMTV